MKASDVKWTTLGDLVIVVLGATLLWRLYDPLAPMTFVQPVDTVRTESITIESVIRELHEHADGLPEETRTKLKEDLKVATRERDELFRLMEEANQLDTELNQLAVEMWARLTEAQRKELVETRNTVSVQQIEQMYWKETEKGLTPK